MLALIITYHALLFAAFITATIGIFGSEIKHIIKRRKTTTAMKQRESAYR